ncbi:MAG: 4-(cytidine 5'-diphospho)-2-C-methyl-D-erythritol kinase [Clostridia bacterium]|nr:4-(cytidine 5'-diphospho)-2-C-methyl-D-erythritol kinase [Clostridia bacterium]
MKLTMTAKAKINLTLKVLGRRENGYHDIQSIMQLLEFGDEVSVEWQNTPGIRVTCSQKDLPTDENNIAYRAAELMQKTYGISGGFQIHLEKKIPVAAGLAGGSTNAAAVMHLINRLCKLQLSFSELASLGLTLGADVPFCLYGKPALAEGIGEILSPASGLLDCYVVLANPGIGVSTGAIYKAIDEASVAPKTDTKKLLAALAQGDLAEAFLHMENMMEPVAESFCPEIREILSAIKKTGADHVMMSGSGATCFGIYLKKPDEQMLKKILGNSFVALTTPVQ